MKKRFGKVRLFILMMMVVIMTAASAFAAESSFEIYKNDVDGAMSLGIKAPDSNKEAKLYMELTQFPYEYGWTAEFPPYYYTLNDNTLELNKSPFVDYFFPVSIYNFNEFFRIPIAVENVELARGFYTFKAYLEDKSGNIIYGPSSVTFNHECYDDSCQDFVDNCKFNDAFKNADENKCKCDPQSCDAADDLQGQSGEVRVNLKWSDCNDLDLHVIDPCGNRIYFDNKQDVCSNHTGELDVDSNAESCSPNPAENIVWTNGAPKGNYTVYVHYYEGTGSSSSYTVTIFNGDQRTEYKDSISYGMNEITTFTH